MRWIAIGVALPALAGCAAPVKPSPRVFGEELRAMRTVCVESVDVEIPFRYQKQRLGELLAVLLQELPNAGLAAVAPDRVQAVVKEFQKTQRDLYDPYTGILDEAAYERARKDLAERYRRELGCDGVLTAHVAIVKAPINTGKAEWDGVQDPVRNSISGWVKALSLWISIRDMDRRQLYFGTGGIEPLFSLGPTKFIDPQDVVASPDEVILGSERKNRRAIRAALSPLLRPTPS
jgi:hypothetical protein